VNFSSYQKKSKNVNIISLFVASWVIEYYILKTRSYDDLYLGVTFLGTQGTIINTNNHVL